MARVTRRQAMSILGAAASVSAFKPRRARAAETVTVWWTQGVYKAENDAVINFMADWEKRTGNKVNLTIMNGADLITTIDHNVTHGDIDPRFQRKVMYRDMPASVVPEFRKLSAAQGMAVLQKLDAWLAARTAAEDRGSARPAPTVRLGLGIYYFEETVRPAGESTAQGKH